MGCNCGGRAPRPRSGTSPGSTHWPTHDPNQVWHVWFPGASEPTPFSHEWQANAAHANHGGRLYPPGTLPNHK